MMDNRYKTSANCVYSLKYHLVWCPKYRKKVLVGQVEARLRELLYEKANNMGVEIEALEIMPDHVHMFVSADPTEALKDSQISAKDGPRFYGRNLRL